MPTIIFKTPDRFDPLTWFGPKIVVNRDWIRCGEQVAEYGNAARHEGNAVCIDLVTSDVTVTFQAADGSGLLVGPYQSLRLTGGCLFGGRRILACLQANGNWRANDNGEEYEQVTLT
jgi:hypothetical protein